MSVISLFIRLGVNLIKELVKEENNGFEPIPQDQYES